MRLQTAILFITTTITTVESQASNQWYVNYANDNCHKDCDIALAQNGTDLDCGGLAEPTEQLFASATQCCEAKLAHIALPYCEGMSQRDTPYLGSGKYYPDYTNDKCVPDCNEGLVSIDGGACGGIVKESSVQLFDTIAECCETKLSFLGEFCVVNSDPSLMGSELFFADEPSGYCVKDVEPANCPELTSCARATKNNKLYPDIATCCSSALGYVATEYCEAMGYYTEKWVVDYPNEVCKKECNTTEDILGICVEDIKEVADVTTKLYDTAEECCAEKLSTVQYCAESSQMIEPEGSLKWYVSHVDNHCYQDCPVDDSTPSPTPAGTDPLATSSPTLDPLAGNETTYNPCGGLAEPYMTLFDTETACCEGSLAHVSLPFCEGMSAEGEFNGTNLYYPDDQKQMCVQDCEVGANGTDGGTCGGIIEEAYVTLYQTPEQCCSEKLGYVQYCVEATLGIEPEGSQKWYVSWADKKCLQDCPVDDSTPSPTPAGTDPLATSAPTLDPLAGNATEFDACGGLATPDMTLFDSETICCQSTLSYISLPFCEAMSSGGVFNGTNLYYPDGEKGMCVQDCEVGANGTDGGTCGGIIEESWMQLFETPELCCSEKLGYVQYCVETTMGLEPAGSQKWYVSYEDKKCVQDCPVDDSTPSPTPAGTDPLATSAPTLDPLAAGNATCGGLAEPYMTLFDSETICCQSTLSYISLPFCEAMSSGGVFNGTNLYYPDYQNGMCVQDCEVGANATDEGATCGGIINESWMEMYLTPELCCAQKLSSVQYCAETSKGIEPEGSQKWYVSYEDNRCYQDCSQSTPSPTPAGTDPLATSSPTLDPLAAGNATCGGLAEPYMTLFGSETICCQSTLSHISLPFCEAMSSEGEFNGTGKFYVDYENDMCAEDCEGNATNGGICGGIIEESSVELFDDATACCEAKLSYLELEYCVDNSLVAIEGTDHYFAVSEGHCVKDAVNCTDPDLCGDATSNDKLFDDISSCCSGALAWITTELCETRSLNATYSNLWFVDSEMCVQDCDPALGAPCGEVPGMTIPLFATVESCCAEKLSYIDSTECKMVSEGGSQESYPGTSKWYADTQTCVQDCVSGSVSTPSPSPDPLATAAPTLDPLAPTSEFCAGIVDATYTDLFDDTAACCEAKLAYIETDLCVAMSTETHSEKFYVDYTMEVCVQDCNGTALPCAGYPSDVSTALFDTVESCCAEKLSWVNTCVADSQGIAPVGTGKFYISWDRMKCVADCIETDGPPCGGIVPNWIDENQMYDDSTTCCSTHLSDLTLEECVLDGTLSPTPDPLG